MEEVAAEEHDVGAVLGRELEHLVKGLEGVLLADLVLLPGSEVVVRGDEDAEDVVVVARGVGGSPACLLCWGEKRSRLRRLRRTKGKERKKKKSIETTTGETKKLSVILFFFFCISLLACDRRGPPAPL